MKPIFTISKNSPEPRFRVRATPAPRFRAGERRPVFAGIPRDGGRDWTNFFFRPDLAICRYLAAWRVYDWDRMKRGLGLKKTGTIASSFSGIVGSDNSRADIANAASKFHNRAGLYRLERGAAWLCDDLWEYERRRAGGWGRTGAFAHMPPAGAEAIRRKAYELAGKDPVVVDPSPITISTSYKGLWFESRHAAHWAAFFDALGVKWEYKPKPIDMTSTMKKSLEAHEGGAGKDEEGFPWSPEEVTWAGAQAKILCSPDFYLPQVKGGLHVMIEPYHGPEYWGELRHTPLRWLGGILVHGLPGTQEEETYEVCTFYDIPYFFGYCPICRSFDFGFMAWRERICKPGCTAGGYRKDDMTETADYRRAAKAAREAAYQYGRVKGV